MSYQRGEGPDDWEAAARLRCSPADEDRRTVERLRARAHEAHFGNNDTATETEQKARVWSQYHNALQAAYERGTLVFSDQTNKATTSVLPEVTEVSLASMPHGHGERVLVRKEEHRPVRLLKLVGVTSRGLAEADTLYVHGNTLPIHLTAGIVFQVTAPGGRLCVNPAQGYSLYGDVDGNALRDGIARYLLDERPHLCTTAACTDTDGCIRVGEVRQ